MSFFVLKITFCKKTKFIDNFKFFALKMQNKAIFAKIATLSVARATFVARPPPATESAPTHKQKNDNPSRILVKSYQKIANRNRL